VENVAKNSDHEFMDVHPVVGSDESYPVNINNRPYKQSFLFFRNNKYVIVPTETIAFFYIKFEATVIVTFNKQEFSVNYSLDQIQEMLSNQQFFRLNRQYLINFNAVKDVEHWFARKLLVNVTIPYGDKLIVSKEKARSFLDWLEKR
jgi:DNA-binding LytR/AlgR family response regulator